jgi:hypothetical protein
MSRIKENLMGYDGLKFESNDPLYTRAINELVEYDVNYMSLTEMYHIVTNAKRDHYVAMDKKHLLELWDDWCVDTMGMDGDNE